MPEAVRPGRGFAVQNEEQYRPVPTIGDQYVRVSGTAGTALLACHASRPLDAPRDGGANRLERGLYYDRHVRRLARAARLAMGHRLIQLTGIGHAADDVLAAPQTREIMFG